MADKKRSNTRADGSRGAEDETTLRADPPAEALDRRPGVRADDLPLPAADVGLDLDAAPANNAEFEALVHRMLEMLGEDPDRAGLLKTPERVSNSLTWLTRGYGMDVNEVVGDAVFEDPYHSMVMVRDIELYSLCEHHM